MTPEKVSADWKAVYEATPSIISQSAPVQDQPVEESLEPDFLQNDSREDVFPVEPTEEFVDPIRQSRMPTAKPVPLPRTHVNPVRQS